MDCFVASAFARRRASADKRAVAATPGEKWYQGKVMTGFGSNEKRNESKAFLSVHGVVFAIFCTGLRPGAG